MRRRFAFALMVVMLGAGCPETWREGGTIDRAMAKDIEEELHRHNCYLSREEWKKNCDSPAAWEDFRCPHECQFTGAE
jgi:hypothetical protein